MLDAQPLGMIALTQNYSAAGTGQLQPAERDRGPSLPPDLAACTPGADARWNSLGLRQYFAQFDSNKPAGRGPRGGVELVSIPDPNLPFFHGTGAPEKEQEHSGRVWTTSGAVSGFSDAFSGPETVVCTVNRTGRVNEG